MATSIKFNGFKEYADKLKNSGRTLLAVADAEASVSAINIERLAKQKAPINLGNLRATINHQKVKDGVWEVTVSAEYAAYMEFGTKSKVSIPPGLEEYARQFKGPGTGKNPKEMIFAWCKQKGIPEEAWQWIYISIMVKGVKPQPFLFPSVREEEPKFLQNVKAAIEDL